MLKYRDPEKTKIVSISGACTEDFENFYGKEYTKFKRIDILHPSELDENRHKISFFKNPKVLGNWNHVKKGKAILPKLKKNLTNFRFVQLDVKIVSGDIRSFNKKKQDIYLDSDIFLQISNSEGNSYATLDALLCGLPIVASNVGLFYKDVPENCFVKMDWRRNSDVNYVKEKIEEAWRRREELSKNCRQWYLDNCRFIDWEKKMKELVS